MPSCTNVNDVPPCFSIGSRGSWTSTNPGAWNGGSSPQGSSPRLNITRPMITAPRFESSSSMNAPSGLASPPSSPCGSRQLSSPNIHSWSRSPSSPIGLSGPALTPAEYPSSEIDCVATTLPTDAPLPVVAGGEPRQVDPRRFEAAPFVRLQGAGITGQRADHDVVDADPRELFVNCVEEF